MILFLYLVRSIIPPLDSPLFPHLSYLFSGGFNGDGGRDSSRAGSSGFRARGGYWFERDRQEIEDFSGRCMRDLETSRSPPPPPCSHRLTHSHAQDVSFTHHPCLILRGTFRVLTHASDRIISRLTLKSGSIVRWI